MKSTDCCNRAAAITSVIEPAGILLERRGGATIIQSGMETISDSVARRQASETSTAQCQGISEAWHSITPLLLIALIIFAAVVRTIATHNDLWLDELISLRIANAVKSPWQIFTAVHQDNNHYLNTLYLYFVRTENYPPLYRYLSVLWGVALVPAGYWLLSRRSRIEALILAALLACSYPLIHFSSEARGYSGALLGSVMACAALSRWLAREDGQRTLPMGVLYGCALTLAILSHLTACLIWFPLAAGSLIVIARRPAQLKWLWLWAVFNSLPAMVFVTLYFLDLGFLTELGGSPMSVFHGLSRLLALGLGWPAKDAISVWIVAVPVMALVVWRLADQKKSGEPLGVLLPLIYVVPLVCVLVMQPSFFSARYFLVFLPFFYTGLAMLLAKLSGTTSRRMALAGVLALFLAGQARLYAKFLQVGRGQFTAALQYMMARTPQPRIVIASNQDFRSGVELAYFAPRVLHNHQLLYLTRENHASFQPDWYILHQEGDQVPGPSTFNVPGQPTWYRAAYFGASELSGQAWTIYSHQPTN